jgi:transposase
MKKMAKCSIIGIDISKDKLDIATFPEGEVKQFDNTKKGHTALLKWLAKQEHECIIFEPTGAYHRLLEERIAEAGFTYCKINPRQAHAFAKALGQKAKTDKMDALMLAKMGSMMRLEPTQY